MLKLRETVIILQAACKKEMHLFDIELIMYDREWYWQYLRN